MPQSLKEKILVISPTVPRPDMNSGDLRLFSILKILAREYVVTFFADQEKPGDDIYLSLLERSGIEISRESTSLKKTMKTVKFKFAILEFFFTAEYYLDRIRLIQPECRVIVDSVDVHFLRLKQKYEITESEIDHMNYVRTKQRELDAYRKADAVITVTKEDASALKCRDITCEVVPNIHEICTNDYSPSRSDLIFVGGFSHHPNVDAVLYFCHEILPLIRIEKPDVHLTVVGSNPPEQIRKLESDNIKVTGYVPETTPYLHRSVVSVAPLRYGAGMKGKIGEAMAHGVPVVTTSVGIQGMGLTNRKNIMVADCPRSFASATLELINDSHLHATIRDNALKFIDCNYTHRQVAHTIFSVLERVGRRSSKRMVLREKIVFLNNYFHEMIKSKLSSAKSA